MPLLRPIRAALRLPRVEDGLAPPGGRVLALGLVALGLGMLVLASAPMLVGAQTALTPHDPGVRGGPAGAGGPVSGLSASQQAFFENGSKRFNEVDSVSGTLPGEPGVGLGARFNLNSCGGCHAQPALGGSSPFVNPQVSVATLDGATNQVPFFVTTDGPVREARFIHKPDGAPDGGVHDLFTITGRTDAPGCSLQQPNFAAQASAGNLVLRIPTPTFGGGFIEAIPDATILANEEANGVTKSALGIAGHANHEGNAGTITRFGWKAQNKSLQIFAGEAYLVEMGVSNELFTQERGEPGDRPGLDGRAEPNAACLFNATPEDTTNFDTTLAAPAVPSDTVQFSTFTRLLDQPHPVPLSTSAQLGQTLFGQVGCAMCHTPSLQTGRAAIPQLSNKTANLYSDLLVHRMGSGLADGIGQGSATGDEFRTAPLWGVGQRIFFMHDGRTRDLLRAIELHSSSGSEANAVVTNFNALGPVGQQAILDFLRSL